MVLYIAVYFNYVRQRK